MYSVIVDSDLDKVFNKLSKKNPKQFEIIWKKIEEIRQDPNRYKNLRASMNQYKRVHIDKHFVLTFSVDEKNRQVVLEDYEHHDEIYQH